MVDRERAGELERLAADWPDRLLTERQRCDLELLACGAFSPLTGFMDEADHAGVCDRMRLADGTLWPMPVTLDVDDQTLRNAESCGHLALRDADGHLLAALELRGRGGSTRPRRRGGLRKVRPRPPDRDQLLHRTKPWYVTGRLEVLPRTVHAAGREGSDLRFTPAALRRHFDELGCAVSSPSTRATPCTALTRRLTLRAARETGAHLLVQPVVGPTKPGDIDVGTRVACYRRLMPSYPAGKATLALLPLAMRMGGPREALWHAIIRQNFGATHMIVGRDHAGPGTDSQGRPFFHPYAAQELVRRYQHELEVTMVAFPQLGYVESTDTYEPVDEVPPGTMSAPSREPRSGSAWHGASRCPRGSRRPPWPRC